MQMYRKHISFRNRPQISLLQGGDSFWLNVQVFCKLYRVKVVLIISTEGQRNIRSSQVDHLVVEVVSSSGTLVVIISPSSSCFFVVYLCDPPAVQKLSEYYFPAHAKRVSEPVGSSFVSGKSGAHQIKRVVRYQERSSKIIADDLDSGVVG